MKSAKIIRICSIILALIEVIAGFAAGIMMGEKVWPIFAFCIGVPFLAVLQCALHYGFADLIDNSYAIVNGGIKISAGHNEEDEAEETEKEDPEMASKRKYADELFEKGLISKFEHDQMLK